MKIAILATQHNQILAQRNLLLWVGSISLSVNLLLASTNFYMVGREKIIISPPFVTSQFWVSTDSVSDSYLEQMSDFFTGLVLNVTPNNFELRSQQMLQHVDSASYSLVKTHLVEQQTEITRRAMSTSFHPGSFKVDRQRLLVEVRGELKILVGNEPIESKTRLYQIQFTNRQGRLYIKQFKEVGNV